MIKFIELFAGIGGFSLGFERAGMECVGHCEIDPYAQKVLLKHWPEVPLWPDITKLQPEEIGEVDLICGGFPCQDISVAGKQGGIHGKRSGLFDEIIRLCRVLRPKYIVLENVANLIARPDWFGYVLGRLSEIGYDAEWEIISAADVGAPHLRKRIWIVAYPNSSRKKRKKSANWKRGRFDLDGKPQSNPPNEEFVADPNEKRIQGPSKSRSFEGGRQERNEQFIGCGEGRDFWKVEPGLGGGFNGFPLWLDLHTGGLSYEESRRAIKKLQMLWNKNVSKKVWEAIGGFNRIQKSEILFKTMWKYQSDPEQTRILMASPEALKEEVRRLWVQGKITGSPYRSRYNKQHEREYSDSLQTLSWLLAHPGEENWKISSWENGIARVTNGVPKRVDRLKCLGNALVPQIAEFIGNQIMEFDDEKLNSFLKNQKPGDDVPDPV